MIGEGSTFIIIDDSSIPPKPYHKHHHCQPIALIQQLPSQIIQARSFTPEVHYEKAGHHLLYYPTYHHTYQQALFSLGFQEIYFDQEARSAESLKGNWTPTKAGDLRLATLAYDIQKPYRKNIITAPCLFDNRPTPII